MNSFLFKVSDQIAKEFDLIQDKEGLNSRTSTLMFLVKYYFLTQNKSLDQSISTLNSLLDRLDLDKLPSAEEQLKA